MGLRNQDIEVHEELIGERDVFVVTVKGWVSKEFTFEDDALNHAIALLEMIPGAQTLMELRLMRESYRLDSLTVVDGGQS